MIIKVVNTKSMQGEGGGIGDSCQHVICSVCEAWGFKLWKTFLDALSLFWFKSKLCQK